MELAVKTACMIRSYAPQPGWHFLSVVMPSLHSIFLPWCVAVLFPSRICSSVQICPFTVLFVAKKAFSWQNMHLRYKWEEYNTFVTNSANFSQIFKMQILQGSVAGPFCLKKGKKGEKIQGSFSAVSKPILRLIKNSICNIFHFYMICARKSCRNCTSANVSFSRELAWREPLKTTRFAWPENGNGENESDDQDRDRRKSCLIWSYFLTKTF